MSKVRFEDNNNLETVIIYIPDSDDSEEDYNDYNDKIVNLYLIKKSHGIRRFRKYHPLYNHSNKSNKLTCFQYFINNIKDFIFFMK
jgi:hypothetical protein